MGFADEPPTWGHPPDPKVQSKSFKRLQRHLQEHEEDGMYDICDFFPSMPVSLSGIIHHSQAYVVIILGLLTCSGIFGKVFKSAN